MSTTGVAGLTLGGGTGYLARHFGLTVDNLLSVDVVLADGSFVTANADSHPDLFWALRGGGGNFGVATSFTFRCHPVGEAGVVIGGPVLYDIADTEEVFRWYRDLVPDLPDELNGWIGVLEIPSAAPFPEELWARKACGIVWCYSGRHDGADEVLAPMREFGSPVLMGLQRCRSRAPERLRRPAAGGPAVVLEGGLLRGDHRRGHRVAPRYGESIPTPLSTMHLYPISGAAARVPEDATAFAFRGGGWNGVIGGIDPDPANLAAITDWARRYWEDLHPFSAGGGYVNMMMDEGQERVRAAYRGNYDRLVEIKRRYDPQNLFRINQNIEPGDPVGLRLRVRRCSSRASGYSSSAPAWPASRPRGPCTGSAPASGGRRSAARRRGLGLYLPGNAVRALRPLGLETASPTGRLRSSDSASPTTVRACCSRSASTRSGAGVGACLALPRADLHDALLEEADDVPIAWGTHPSC